MVEQRKAWLDSSLLLLLTRRWAAAAAPGQVTRVVDEEEKRIMAEATWVYDGFPRKIDQIVSRRKKKKAEGGFEYEVSWLGLPSIKWNKCVRGGAGKTLGGGAGQAGKTLDH